MQIIKLTFKGISIVLCFTLLLSSCATVVSGLAGAVVESSIKKTDNKTSVLGESVPKNGNTLTKQPTSVASKTPLPTTTVPATPVVQNQNVPTTPSSDVDKDLPIEKAVNSETFAIIIANENYKNVASVPYALNDARTFYQYCHQVLGIPKENMHLAENATYGEMSSQISWIKKVAKAYDGDAKIIFYYAGHGIPSEKDGTSYLLPIDNIGNDLSVAYSLSRLYKELGTLNAKNVTLFMDACFSGAGRDDQMLTAARGVAMVAKEENPLGNMVVFSAAQGDETAHPYLEKGHGLFTYFLLKKLKETKGKVTFGELDDFLRKSVSRKSIVANNKAQTPQTQCSPQMLNSWKGMTLK